MQRAHPRSRGENVRLTARTSLFAGSSPLTRGKRENAPGDLLAEGLIPAHAGKTGRSVSPLICRPAHPRSRGENVFDHAEPTIAHGSSPLTRGKRETGKRGRTAMGLIPAHAGKTTPISAATFVAWAHPRSRGENLTATGAPPSVFGSSPLTRGKLRGVHAGHHALRLIPAHAGKTSRVCLPPCLARAHPRSRGENIVDRIKPALTDGSSPLTRGKQIVLVGREIAHRLIPAHAGKTRLRVRRRRARWAHPRSRGENLVGEQDIPVEHGSSPLTRGKHVCRDCSLVGLRLIPAHAGKTRPLGDGKTGRAAHPRSRGENVACGAGAGGAGGSSPLTRGKLGTALPVALGDGLIPAHAGKTVDGPGTMFQQPAHPRSRGENSPMSTPKSAPSGSSPLTRGKLGCPLRTDQGRRLIPAHAGKTPPERGRRGLQTAHPRSRGENTGRASPSCS